MKDKIRFNHAFMEYDHEIQYCKEVLESGVTGEVRKHVEDRIKAALENKKKLLQNKGKLLGTTDQ